LAGHGAPGTPVALPGSPGARTPEPPPPHPDLIDWQKTQIDPVFRSEGVAVADINQDGLPDIVVGDVWYEAPNWQMHEIRDVGDYGDGHDSYSNAFQVFTGDFNNDGWPDVLVVGFPGDPVYWYENPQNQPGHWREHLVWPTSANESPQFVDLFGDGQKELVMAIQPEGQMVWLRPGPDPTQLWVPHPISVASTPNDPVPGTDIFSHGLGVGDLNGDGRLDVMTTGGWWEQPAVVDGTTPWPFHPADLGQPCADMYAYDMNGDGVADVISTSAHDYGMWWHEQVPGSGGDPTFVEHELLPPLFSQSHALQMADLNGDGVPDLVTGKRFWAHGPDGDPGSGEPAVLYWFEGQRQEDGSTQFIPHLIDDSSGIGTQFTVADLNGDGLLDIITSNKKGVFVFEQQPSAGSPPFQAGVSALPDSSAASAGLLQEKGGLVPSVCPLCHCPQPAQPSGARVLHSSESCPLCHCAPRVNPGGQVLADPLGGGAGCPAC
jgi:hypothetical protein